MGHPTRLSSTRHSMCCASNCGVVSFPCSGAEFPWLRSVALDQSRCALIGLDAVSGNLAPQLVEEGLSAILAHKLGLLSAFIGDDVVLPLVEQSWGAALPSDRPSSTEGEP
jgi:hypothetical protein